MKRSLGKWWIEPVDRTVQLFELSCSNGNGKIRTDVLSLHSTRGQSWKIASPSLYQRISINVQETQVCYVIYEVLRAFTVTITALSDVTPCSLIHVYRRF
jgi:hypothetical protein